MRPLLPLLAALLLAAPAQAEKVGEVSTAFILIGANHKVVVEAYDDPKVNGVTCYVSRARTGGVMGAIGLAEDKAETDRRFNRMRPSIAPRKRHQAG